MDKRRWLIIPKYNDLTGQKFGRLIVKRFIGKEKNKCLMWECECTCPLHTIVNVRGSNLTTGCIVSCGCYRSEMAAKNARRAAKTKFERTSKYKGVSWYKRDNMWVVQIMFQGKYHYLGEYHDEIIAAKIYNAKAIELFGENAWLNPV